VLEPDPELAVEYGLFSVSQARAAGHTHAAVKRQVRRGSWIRTGHNMLRVADRSERPADGMVLARLLAGPGAVVGFESAAYVLGWDLPHPPGPPRMLVPRAATHSGEYRTDLSAEDVMVVGVLVISGPARTALDIAATCDFTKAVIILDSALRSRQVTREHLADVFACSRRNGILAARRALASSDALSGSVPETEARLLFAAAGLPAPTTQFPVRDGRRFVARVDFAWERARLVVEIDGFAYHSASGDFQRDRTSQNAVQLKGWLVLRFTVADIRDRPELVVAQIVAALAR
jgi:hypothetical protein